MEFPSCHPIYDTNMLVSLDMLEVFHKHRGQTEQNHVLVRGRG